MPVGNVRPLNQVQRIPQTPDIRSLTLTAPAVILFEEEEIYTVPTSKKTRIKGTFIVDNMPSQSVTHEVFVVKTDLTEVSIYIWSLSGSQDFFSPTNMRTGVGIEGEFILEAGEVLKHRYTATLAGRQSTLVINISKLEVPA